MNVISVEELQKNCAAVLDAVEAGETYRITRNEREVAELRSLRHRRRLASDELIE